MFMLVFLIIFDSFGFKFLMSDFQMQ